MNLRRILTSPSLRYWRKRGGEEARRREEEMISRLMRQQSADTSRKV